MNSMPELKNKHTRVYRLVPDPRMTDNVPWWMWLIFGLILLPLGILLLLVYGQFVVLPFEVRIPLVVFAAAFLNFIFIGSYSIYRVFRGLGGVNRFRALKQAHPNEPWKYDYKWDREKVLNESGGKGKRFLGETLFLVLLFVVLDYFVFFRMKAVFTMGHVVLGLFNLLPIWGIIATIRKYIQTAKFRNTCIYFDCFPYKPGQKLVLYFKPPELKDREIELKAVLRHAQDSVEKMWDSRHGQSLRFTVIEHYREERPFTAGPDDIKDQRGVRLEFDLPPGDLETRLSDDLPRYWELRVTGKTRGVDYSGLFPLPVYK